MYKLGKWVQSKGGIPVGGSDNNKLWEVFTAEDKPVVITCGGYWSGDASEYYTFMLVPPNFALNGTLGPADILGCIPLMVGNIEGNLGTIASPISLMNSYQRSSGPHWVIPPEYSIAVMPVTAASTADFGVRVGGFECE